MSTTTVDSDTFESPHHSHGRKDKRQSASDGPLSVCRCLLFRTGKILRICNSLFGITRLGTEGNLVVREFIWRRVKTRISLVFRGGGSHDFKVPLANNALSSRMKVLLLASL